MYREELSRFAAGRLVWQSDTPGSGLLQRVLQRRASELLVVAMSSALVFVLSLCVVTLVEAQEQAADPTAPLRALARELPPPQQATANAIANLCPALPTDTPARIDLKARCTEIVTQPGLPETRNALLETSPVKIPAAGTSQVEGARVQIANIGGSLAAIGGRLTALRGGQRA
jgi:hypothetical protein